MSAINSQNTYIYKQDKGLSPATKFAVGAGFGAGIGAGCGIYALLMPHNDK